MSVFVLLLFIFVVRFFLEPVPLRAGPSRASSERASRRASSGRAERGGQARVHDEDGMRYSSRPVHLRRESSTRRPAPPRARRPAPYPSSIGVGVGVGVGVERFEDDVLDLAHDERRVVRRAWAERRGLRDVSERGRGGCGLSGWTGGEGRGGSCGCQAAVSAGSLEGLGGEGTADAPREQPGPPVELMRPVTRQAPLVYLRRVDRIYESRNRSSVVQRRTLLERESVVAESRELLQAPPRRP